MDLTGTLWRVKSDWAEVFRTPRPYVYGFDTAAYREEHRVALLKQQSIVLVASERIPREVLGEHYLNKFELKQTFVKIVSPLIGYMNSTYFTKDSIWLERLA